MAIPENAIVVDESITTGRGFFPPTAAAAPHDWLQNMGGSIGFSTPVATGAAVACPDRKVICMVGDGSAMYTIQSLWTQARENLNVLTIVFANRIYQILRGEFDGVGAGEPGQRAQDMLKIDRPTHRLRLARQGHGRSRPRGRQWRRFRQGAGGSDRRRRAAADRSADVRELRIPGGTKSRARNRVRVRCGACHRARNVQTVASPGMTNGSTSFGGHMQTELNKVVTALDEFYARETFLLEKDLGERTLTHRLAVHLEKQFPGWEVDCDYDRLGERTLRLPHGTDRLDRRSSRQIGLSRYRRAPARDPEQPARDRGAQGRQPSAAGTRPAQAARADRPASVVRLLDRRLSDAGQEERRSSDVYVGGVIDAPLSAWFSQRLKDAGLGPG